MINWFNMPVEGLSNGGQFEIKELTATENKVYEKDGEVYNKVTVNVSGGGSSDFTTAEVTVVNNGATPTEMYFPFIVTDVEEGIRATMSLLVPNGHTVQENAILYKGKADLYFPNGDSNVVITGNAEKIEDAFYCITGDCTITITADK